jgi:hypothetical protein
MHSGKISKILCLYSHFYNRIAEGLSAVLCEYGSIKFTEIPDARTSCVHPPRSLSTREVLKEIICLSSHFLVRRGRIYRTAQLRPQLSMAGEIHNIYFLDRIQVEPFERDVMKIITPRPRGAMGSH